MSKPSSGHFSGTTGANHANHTQAIQAAPAIKSTSKDDLDYREHPVKNYSSTSINKIRNKVASRTATKNEYKKLEQNRRLSNRRKAGVREFWRQERERLRNNQKGTRNWSAEQIRDIKAGRTPKLNGKPMQSHHTYAVSKYPHLANKGKIIYPVTYDEHFYGFHNGNFKTSLPGKPYPNFKPQF